MFSLTTLDEVIEQFIASGSEVAASPFRKYDEIFYLAYRLLDDAIECQEFIVFGDTPNYIDGNFKTILFERNCSLNLNRFYTDKDVQHIQKTWTTLEIPSHDHRGGHFDCLVLYKGRLKLKKNAAEKIVRIVGRLLSDLTKQKSTALWDKIVQITLGTKNHSSFFYKAVTDDLLSYVSIEGASVFFQLPHETALTLASTTGLRFGRKHQFKRADIKYQKNSKSYVRQCFDSAKIIFEMSSDGTQLKENTYGEDVNHVFNRLFMPIQIRSSLIAELEDSKERFSAGKIGVLRVVNFRRNGLSQPISCFENYVLQCFCEFLSVLGTRYIKAINAESDIERATHGYITDLLTLKMNAQVYERHYKKFQIELNSIAQEISNIDSIDTKNIVQRTLNTLLSMNREWGFFYNDFSIIQAAMAAQLNTVLDRSGRVMGADENNAVFENCEKPFADVLMPLSDACSGMSRYYNRLSFSPKFDGGRATKEFMLIPAVALPQRVLFHAARNILENSVKYTPRDKVPEVDIRWSMQGKLVCFEFHDGGIGITEEAESLLFTEEGFRSREAIICNLRGNGLGLAQSRDSLRGYGAELSYIGKSQLLGGAHFNITVPTI